MKPKWAWTRHTRGAIFIGEGDGLAIIAEDAFSAEGRGQVNQLKVQTKSKGGALVRPHSGVTLPFHSLFAYLNGDGPYQDRIQYPLPHLVLLDIKMPTIDGFEVLRWIRRQPGFARLCVAMLTTSDEIREVNLAYQLGANLFLVKPLDFWNAAELSRSLGKLVAKC